MASRIYCAKAVYGGAEGALDTIDGNDLSDNDMCIVIDPSDNTVTFWRLEASGGHTGTENTDFVVPDTNPGAKEWWLLNLRLDDLTIRDDIILITDDITVGGQLNVGLGDGTGTTDAYFYTGTNGDHIFFDASEKTLTFSDVTLATALVTLGGKLTADAVEIEGSNFDINGGDISAATISGGLTWSFAQDLNNVALTNANIDTGDIAAAVVINFTDTGSYYTTDTLSAAMLQIGQALEQGKLNGIEDTTAWALSSDAGNPPTITITWTGTVGWWSDGLRYTDSGTDNIQISDASGPHWIYYNGATLSEIDNPTGSQLYAIFTQKCLVAMVYWETNTNTAIVLANELHGNNMSGATHWYEHVTTGAKWVQGGVISGYTLSTASDAAISFDLTNIVFYDEDIVHQITDGVAANQYEQVLTGDAEIPVAYKDDVDGSWIEQAASTLPYLVGATPRIQYVKDDGDGSWSRVEVGNSQFCLYYLVVTNDWQYPVKMIPGSAVYATKIAAVEGIETEVIAWGDMPSREWVLLYVFVMQDGSGGTTDAQIVDIYDYRQQTVSATLAVSATDHGGLSGLGDDDHPQYLLANGTRALAGAWSMGSQATTNVNIDSGNIDGTAIGAATPSTIVGTTIDAGTDFTVGNLVLTTNNITNGAVAELAIDVTSLAITSTQATGNTLIVNIGEADNNAGAIGLYSDDNTAGPYIVFVVPPDNDGDGTTSFTIQVNDNSDDFYIGCSNDESMLQFLGGATPSIVIDCNWTATGETCADLGTVTTCDINGGSIDGATLGAAASCTLTAVDINGGTLAGVTVDGSLTWSAAQDLNSQNLTNVNIDSGSIDGVTIGAASAPTVTDLGSVATCDINGGTIDAVTIGSHTQGDAALRTLDPSPASDTKASGDVIAATVDTNTVGYGGCVYLNAGDGNWDDVDKDATATAGPVMIGIALGTTGAINVLLKGFVRVDAWNWTISAPVFIGDSGALTQDVSGYASGDVVRCVGHAYTADILYFNPSPDYLTIA